jgi:hypothetical protein
VTRTYLPPNQGKQIGELDRRVGLLERRITAADTAVDTSHEILFSYSGTLAATMSPPVRVRRRGDLAVLAVTMETAGSTDTTIDVARNGTVIATVTVPASTETYNGLVAVGFDAEDILTLEITSVGTGAADMTAEARFT